MVESEIPNINTEKLETRKYQIDIADNCIAKNSLVVIPTGLGKTIIAILIVAKTIEISPPNSKVIVMAPTKPLINQHYDSFLKFLHLNEDDFVVLTGTINPDKRAKLFNEKKFIFFTPQTLRNDLVKQRYDLSSTCLIIFDECHHASGDYPYTMIADKYVDQNPDGNILALTASPGASKKKQTDLCRSLYIDVENIHTRTRKDTDVQNYLKPLDIYKISVNLSSLMKDAYDVLHVILEERLNYLSQTGNLQVKKEGKKKLHKKIIRKDLLKLNQELVNIISGTGDKKGAYGAISANGQALILYHMIELVEQQGLDILLIYLEKLNKEARKDKCSKGKRILAADPRIRQILIELRKNEKFNPEKIVHPKFQKLKQILIEELKHNPNSRVMVFVKLRDTVKVITEKLNIVSDFKASRFVGQASKSKKDKGLTQKQQIEILELFKKVEYNIMVSTNVGEEGLDIAEYE